LSERILAFVASYPPRLGGGEKLSHRFNAALAADGAQVRVLASVPPLCEERVSDGVGVAYLRAWRLLGFPWLPIGDVARAIRTLRPTFALLYGPSPYDAVASTILRAMGVPFACVYLADFDERKAHTRAATAVHNLIALRQAAGIVCIARGMADRLVARGFAPPIVVEPGVDDAFFATPIVLGGELLFVGGLDEGHRYKRIDLLFEALALRPDLRLRVVGDGDLRGRAERAARDLGVGDRVTFLGAIDDASLAREYGRAGALVLPSPTTQEGFGLVCLEAMASGTPVVCSVRAGAAATVADAPGCAVWNGDDVADLAAAIDRALAAMLPEREALRAYARRYDWGASARAMLDGIRALGIGDRSAEPGSRC
jgi:glycosyltransferase involved in cell wall biosynthesis